MPTEAYNRIEACNTCYNVISPEEYNRIETCNTCYNVISTRITELKHVILVIM